MWLMKLTSHITTVCAVRGGVQMIKIQYFMYDLQYGFQIPW